MRLFERAFNAIIKQGQLTVIDAEGKTFRFGVASPDLPSVTARFTSNAALNRTVTQPSLGAGEAYMNEQMTLEEGDIFDLLNMFTWNGRFEKRGGRQGAKSWKRAKQLLGWARTVNHEYRSKRNVAHHYDLSAALYDLFLDSDRQYSCAYFTDPANSLEQAQLDKKAHIAAKLMLAPGQRVLDIGCGWGGMALYLHQKTGADVLGITLSEEQLKLARERAAAAGISDHVRFELIDYRHVEGQFDRIVSVGMFEHVGPAHFHPFLGKVRALLEPDGVALLHTIGRMGPRRPTDAWTTKYIFPGGYIPTLSEIAEAAEATRLIMSDVETLRLHYAYTLEHWLRRAQAHRTEIEALYDARFFRMWEFYLASSLTGFTNGQMVNYQIQLVRERRALPITRDYMLGTEQALARCLAGY